MSELKYWLWLAALPGVRPRTRTLLLEHFGTPREAYFAPESAFAALEGLEERERAALKDRDLDRALRTLEACAARDIGVLTLQDALYPRRLAAIYDPPAVLFVRGRLPAVDEEAAVAVVGTRSATPYGVKMASRMGYELTKCGGLVVSGLTQGVDGMAARGALMAGGGCVGVLATAIDGDWGGSLARDVESAGALVSEYPPGTESRSAYFRARNRITAGLSVAAVVVEAPEKSGALLFADEAAELGREVFAVPANADAPGGAGVNALLKDGARVAVSGWDVLADFAPRFPGKLRAPEGARASMPPEQLPPEAAAPDAGEKPETGENFAALRVPAAKKAVDKPAERSYIDIRTLFSGLTERQLAVVGAMTEPSAHVDDIIERCGLPAPAVLAELTLLQIRGVVTQEPGKRFTLNIKQK